LRGSHRVEAGRRYKRVTRREEIGVRRRAGASPVSCINVGRAPILPRLARSLRSEGTMIRLRRLAAALPFLVAMAAWAGDVEDGKALQQAGKCEEALAKFEAAAAADPTNADAALGRSQVLAGLGRYDE